MNKYEFKFKENSNSCIILTAVVHANNTGDATEMLLKAYPDAVILSVKQYFDSGR